MSFLALVISLLIAGVGATGIASPGMLLSFARFFRTPGRILAAAAFRVVYGASLYLASPSSRAPNATRILGIVILAAGLVTPLFGVERIGRVVEWWFARGRLLARAWSCLALAFGLLMAFILYS